MDERNCSCPAWDSECSVQTVWSPPSTVPAFCRKAWYCFWCGCEHHPDCNWRGVPFVSNSVLWPIAPFYPSASYCFEEQYLDSCNWRPYQCVCALFLVRQVLPPSHDVFRLHTSRGQNLFSSAVAMCHLFIVHLSNSTRITILHWQWQRQQKESSTMRSEGTLGTTICQSFSSEIGSVVLDIIWVRYRYDVVQYLWLVWREWRLE